MWRRFNVEDEIWGWIRVGHAHWDLKKMSAVKLATFFLNKNILIQISHKFVAKDPVQFGSENGLTMTSRQAIIGTSHSPEFWCTKAFQAPHEVMFALKSKSSKFNPEI